MRPISPNDPIPNQPPVLDQPPINNQPPPDPPHHHHCTEVEMLGPPLETDGPQPCCTTHMPARYICTR